MSLALITSAALLGLAGTPHCAGMCAGGCAAVARVQPEPAAPTRGSARLAAVLLGRASGYAAAGAVVASAVGALRWLGDSVAWLRPGWAAVQLAALLLGLWLLWRGRLPVALLAWADAWRRPRTADQIDTGWVRMRLPGEARAFAIGALWPVIPCGLLHAALLVASLANGPALGAAVMLAFALTSSLGLVLGQWLWQRLLPPAWRRRAAGREDALAMRLAGAMLVVMLGWSVFHTVWRPLQEAWCA
ncbi:MAG: sulfite exporter TauE/SafE family protein [Leptothrix sp. (in: b-proteobacteria)]